MDYAPLSNHQTEYIGKTASSWLNVAEGGKRAGKNVINILAWAACLEHHPDRLHLAAGVTVASAKLNIIDCNGFGLKDLFRGRCREKRYQNREALILDTVTGEKVVLLSGGGRQGDERRIKGNSYGSAYVTEVNECHPSFVREVFDRTISSRRRKLFFDLNPKSPEHWFYTGILAHHEKLQASDERYGLNFGHFTLLDNMSISAGRIAEILSTYNKGEAWYQSDILGKRVASGGRIYTGFERAICAVSPQWIRERQFCALSVGVDVGGTDATVATLTGFTQGFSSAVVIDGYYHRQGKKETHDTQRYAEEICQKLFLWRQQYPGLMLHIYAESADKLFRIALKKQLARQGLDIPLSPAYKRDGILDRIRLHNILINQGRYHIARHLTKWIEAYENAVWDEKRRQNGEWVRLDNGSYPVDCLDSMEYATIAYKKKLLL